MVSLPSVFIGHGAPTTALDRDPTHEFLKGLGQKLERPDAILCVSAHWESERPAASTATAPETIYDFYGFPEPLYQLRYPAPGAPELAARAAELLGGAGLACDLEPDQGLDHGAWIPLLLMYPDADVPVAQLSIQHHLGPAHHLAMGRALAPLRDGGVLILGSGNVTHNLQDAIGRLRGGSGAGDPPPEWAVAFDGWVAERVAEGAVDDLADYRARAPFAEVAHPRDEHFLPLFVVAGAGGGAGRQIHAHFALSSLSMAAFAFGGGSA
jgi:4,5-DOPA dioxygenase extradiol